MNYADLKAMLADAGMTLEILSPSEYAAAIQGIDWPECPPHTEGSQPHCPDCSGIVGETGIV